MSVIYLRHEKYGTKVAISEDEAVADEKEGWKRFQVGALLTPEVHEEPVRAVVLDGETVHAFSERQDLVFQYETKYGKKPHHKLGLEKLRQAVA